MHRTIPIQRWGLTTLCLLLPINVQAGAFPPATWTEKVAIRVASTTNESLGKDDNTPEAIGDTVSVLTNYFMNGYVAFGEAGPPYLTVYAAGRLWKFLSGNFSVTSQSTINFDLTIVQTHVPPVAVDLVPILVESQGDIYGDASCEVAWVCGSATAQGSMVVMQGGTEVFNQTASLHVASDPSKQASLDASKPLSLQPGVNLHGSVTVLTTIAVAGFGYAAVARASMGPSFEITSAVIPGTQYKYADFFKIEYSPGYWALGHPTPVAPTTWGKIKSLYSNH